MSSSLYGGQGSSPSGLMNKNTSTGNFGKPFKERIPEGYDLARVRQFTPEQMKLFQEGFGHVSPDSFTSRLASGDQSAFGDIEAPALRQFNELQGGLASRFSGMGSGARKSSGFMNAANQQASNFAQQLQSQRQGLQRQALSDLFGMSNQLLNQRPWETFLERQPQEPSWAETIGKFGGMIPGLVSSAFGGGSPGDAVKGAGQVFGSISRGGSGMNMPQSQWGTPR